MNLLGKVSGSSSVGVDGVVLSTSFAGGKNDMPLDLSSRCDSIPEVMAIPIVPQPRMVRVRPDS